MPGKQRYTPAQIIAALQDTKGLIYLAARRLGCDMDTIANYCKRYPAVQTAKDAARGEMVDLAELKLWQALQNGEAWAISLCLKTVGKHRGYVERQELAGADGDPLTILIEARTRDANERLVRLRSAHPPSPPAEA